MMPMRNIAVSLPLFAAGLALSACVSLGSKPPPQLLTISSSATLPAGQNVSSAGLPSIMVVTPEVPRQIDTMRVPVQVNPTTVAYVKDAQWTEAPRKMFARLLGDTIAAGGDVFVVSDEQYGMPPGRRLSGALMEFGIDAATREAVVTFDAIIGSVSGETAVRRRFTARVAVSDIQADRIAGPINQAANQVASEVAAWVKAN